MTNLKLIFMPVINDDYFLAYCLIINTVASMIGAPFWGYFGDIKGFSSTLVAITICDTLIKLYGIFVSSRFGLGFLFFILGFVDKGMLTIVGPGLA
jgi:hypothetical protein